MRVAEVGYPLNVSPTLPVTVPLCILHVSQPFNRFQRVVTHITALSSKCLTQTLSVSGASLYYIWVLLKKSEKT